MPDGIPPGRRRRRGLVLAGGALKNAYTAGVLEQLLPELGHTSRHSAFSHVQACSSGVFNAALMAQGREGADIASLWRSFRPRRAISINWAQLFKLFWGESLLTHDRFMKNVVHSKARNGWGLEFPFRAKHRNCHYCFNAYDFTNHELVSWEPHALHEDRFEACIALPRWYPPVRMFVDKDRRDHVLVDAVFTTDSNAAALADPKLRLEEIWTIWTVDIRGHWRAGWTSNYFRMLEQAAASAYRRERQAILDAGFEPAAAWAGRRGRPPKVLYEIAGDVPLHYLLGFTRAGVVRAVDQGAADAAAYLDTHRQWWHPP